ncbi:MAG: DNA topoisomerase, partial [Candidatus Micrarchaeota archaeon]
TKKEKKETTPPRRYTQASIVSELEKRHLGTKATRAAIVDTLFRRGYANGAPIEVTEFGLKVDEVLKKYAPEILDEELTKKIEERTWRKYRKASWTRIR